MKSEWPHLAAGSLHFWPQWAGSASRLGFSLAVPVLWGAARLYGTLGSLVLFLIWTYLIAWILLLGGLRWHGQAGREPPA
jgi:hypothetical protein